MAARDNRPTQSNLAAVALVRLVVDEAWTEVGAAQQLRDQFPRPVLRRVRARILLAVAGRSGRFGERAVLTLDTALGDRPLGPGRRPRCQPPAVPRAAPAQAPSIDVEIADGLVNDIFRVALHLAPHAADRQIARLLDDLDGLIGEIRRVVLGIEDDGEVPLRHVQRGLEAALSCLTARWASELGSGSSVRWTDGLVDASRFARTALLAVSNAGGGGDQVTHGVGITAP